MKVPTRLIWMTSTCLTLRLGAALLTTFCRLDELGLEVTGQRVQADRALLACRIVEQDRWCRRCGEEGRPRDIVTPGGWRMSRLDGGLRRC